MNKIEDFINIKEIEDDNTDLIYIDFKSDGNVMSPEAITRKIKLTKKIKDDKDIISEIVEKINSLSETNDTDILEKFSLKNINEKNETNQKRKIFAKILNSSNYIAVQGRIGSGNKMLVSKENYEKYYLDELDNYDVIFEDVNDIYIFRKNDVDQPGLVMIKNDEKYEIIDVGLYPHKYFLKITC
jgi:hypothetical protein